MFKRLYRAWQQHVLCRSWISDQLWGEAVAEVPVLACLSKDELSRLHKLSSLFLHEKTISGAGGFEVDDRKQILVAAQACLLILNLDLDYFRGWHEIIIYPDTFVISQEDYDDSGVVHETRRSLAGEAWGRGPVILSWKDARPGSHSHGPASNVILHEFAHKLDMLNGAANGMPPLHKDMVRERWTSSLSRAYANLYHQIERHHHTAIDPYAAENPAEFFAVFTEVFFEDPALLHKHYPDVYQQLSLYYRQHPLTRRHQCRSLPGHR